MNSQIQKSFLPMFVMLVVMDFLAQLVNTAGIGELAPLVSMWFGPIDDILYAFAGLQAVYYLIDPAGVTRDPEGGMSHMATAKKIGRLLAQESYRRGDFPNGFFAGSLRAVAIVAQGLLIAVVAAHFNSSDGLTALAVTMQRHLAYMLPVLGLVGAALVLDSGERPVRAWSLVMGAGVVVMLVGTALDGRWANHMHHLLASLSTLQAWGATACWVGLGASFSGVDGAAVSEA